MEKTIQTYRKNCTSAEFPFKIQRNRVEQPFLLSEYENNYVTYEKDEPQITRRDLIRKNYEKKYKDMLIREYHYRLEECRKQEEFREPLKKRPDYYLTKDARGFVDTNIYRPDDVTTFWTYEQRKNCNHRKDTSFTKPHDEKLDAQFG